MRGPVVVEMSACMTVMERVGYRVQREEATSAQAEAEDAEEWFRIRSAPLEARLWATAAPIPGLC